MNRNRFSAMSTNENNDRVRHLPNVRSLLAIVLVVLAAIARGPVPAHAAANMSLRGISGGAERAA